MARATGMAGGGRKSLAEADKWLVVSLDRLVKPVTSGEPMRPLRWTCKSTANYAAQLASEGHPVSPRTVASLLKKQGYSLQSPRKTREGGKHQDRNAQIAHLDAGVRRYLRTGDPVASVVTKRKELVGNILNKGREWQPKGSPVEAFAST